MSLIITNSRMICILLPSPAVGIITIASALMKMVVTKLFLSVL